MEQHQFKVLYSKEEDVYRIIDLTDAAFVGITEMFENDDEYERSKRAEYIKEIKANVGLRARIVGYGIFVTFDDENTTWVPVPERKYALSVLRQMADYFAQKVVNKKPEKFEVYRIPPKKRSNEDLAKRALISAPSSTLKANTTAQKDKDRWFKGWRLASLIVLGVVLIGFIVCLIVFPKFRESIENVIEFIFGLPFIIIMFLAYLDDMLARR